MSLPTADEWDRIRSDWADDDDDSAYTVLPSHPLTITLCNHVCLVRKPWSLAVMQSAGSLPDSHERRDATLPLFLNG